MLNMVIMWGTLIIPWLSLFFLKKEVLRRYMPVAIFTALLMTIYDEIAIDATDWIVIKQNLVPWTAFVPIIYGAFFSITIWIFSLTYGRFWMYVITNVVSDFFFIFVVSPVYEWLGFYMFVERSRIGIYIDIVLLSFVIYGYQMWQEKIMNNHLAPPKRMSVDNIMVSLKRKAR